jgi:HK97 family phage prohead protease
MTDQPPRRAEIETRSATVTDVRFPERVIEVVAVPYDEYAVVEYKGRLIEETFSRGAFGQIQNRASRFLVNLEHDLERVVGRVQALHPDRPDGMIAEIRVRRGPDGDQVLDDADDGMIGASVGFGCLPEHQRWETRSRRRIVKAYLHHLGLTFTPAYHGAGVLAVRSAVPTPPSPTGTIAATVATPNLDKILYDRLVASYSRGQS